MTKIRAAILGYGRSGSTMHAGALERSDYYDVVAVCDIDKERRDQAVERFGCAVYDDYHRMLAEEELDLVCIITRNDQHCAMSCDCLKAGVDVLVTKPWATSAGEARRMIAAEKESGRRLFPWLPARWGSSLRRIRDLVNEGAVGDVFMIRRSVASFALRSDWQTQSEFGGGYLLNWGPHIVDPPLLITGGSPVNVFGRLKQTINPGDREDLFLAVITLDDGTIVQAEYTISVEDLPDWVVQGTRGTIVVHGNQLRLHKSVLEEPDDPTKFSQMKAVEDEVIDEEIEGAPYGDEHEVYDDLGKAITGGTPFPVAVEDALQLSVVFDAIRESGATGNSVAVETIEGANK